MKCSAVVFVFLVLLGCDGSEEDPSYPDDTSGVIHCEGGHWRQCYGPCGEEATVPIDSTCIVQCPEGWSPAPQEISDECATCETGDDCAVIPGEATCCGRRFDDIVDDSAVAADETSTCTREAITCGFGIDPPALAECGELGVCVVAPPDRGEASCEAHSDCVAVTAGCCECGGQRTATSVDQLDDFKEHFCPPGSEMPDDCASCDDEPETIPACLRRRCVLLEPARLVLNACETDAECGKVLDGCCECDSEEVAIHAGAWSEHRALTCPDPESVVCGECEIERPRSRIDCVENRCALVPIEE